MTTHTSSPVVADEYGEFTREDLIRLLRDTTTELTEKTEDLRAVREYADTLSGELTEARQVIASQEDQIAVMRDELDAAGDPTSPHAPVTT